MSQMKASFIAGIAFTLFATIWLAHSPFHQPASDVAPKSSRARLVRLAPSRVGTNLARRDKNDSILPVSNPNPSLAERAGDQSSF